MSTSDDEESRLDLGPSCSLHTGSSPIVASSSHSKAYGARRLGLDLTVTCGANQHFNLEVTRLRAIGDPGNATGRFESGIPRRSDQSSGPAGGEPRVGVARLANVITGKLRELPGAVPNALVIRTGGGGYR